MKAVSLTTVAENNEKKVVRAVIVSNTEPKNLPTTGEGIAGMTADMTFAPMSLIYVIGDAVSKVYMADESGKFVAQ